MHNYYLCTSSALSLSSTHDMMTRWSFSNGKRSQHVTAGWMAAWMNGVEDYYCTLFVFVYTIVCTHWAKSMGMAASYSSLVTTCTAQRSQCSIFSSPQHHLHHHHLTTSRWGVSAPPTVDVLWSGALANRHRTVKLFGLDHSHSWKAPTASSSSLLLLLVLPPWETSHVHYIKPLSIVQVFAISWLDSDREGGPHLNCCSVSTGYHLHLF